METDVTNSITYLICMPKSIKDELRLIRHWSHILFTEKEESIWLKGFKEEELNSALLLQLSQKKIYKEENGYLFYLNTLSPVLIMPKGLTWSTLGESLPIGRPRFNMNYFGHSGEVEVQLKSSENVQPLKAIWTNLEQLKPIMETIPEFRFKHTMWTLFNGNQVILFTDNSLPIKGVGFWCIDQVYMPLGLELNYKYLLDIIKPKDQNLLFVKDDTRVYINSKDIKMLTRSGFRLTTKYIEL